MGEIALSSIFNFFLYLSIPFIFGIFAKKMKLSPLIGYILGGIILGNVFPELATNEAVKNFAYFGIVMLLFTLGLEVNFSQILNLKKIIIIGGTIQILASILFITLFSLVFKFPLLSAFLIGIALSSSSTTLVAKIIQDRGEESSFIGEVAMGILMYQDIAFIPFLMIFTSITSQSISPVNVFINIVLDLVKAAVIIAGLFYVGRKIIPFVFNKIARASRELLNLFIIVFIFFIVLISIVLKIPTLIGVFIAGILLASTLEHHHIFSQVRPFRDLLSVIFFVFIGSNIRLDMVFSAIPGITVFALGVVLIKFLVILAIFLALKFHSKTSFNLALYLFQIDEDAFILMSSALINGVVSKNDYLFVISSVLITLIITPILIKHKNNLYKKTRSFIKKYLPFLENFITYRIDRNQSVIDELQIKNHVVICGYGRIGSYIGRSLMMANIPYLAIDFNLATVEKAKKHGANIIYGDPADIDILDYAQVESAIMVIIAVPDRHSQESIVLNAKKLNKEIFIISRVHREVDQVRMKDLGVNLVVQPEFEASISIIKKIYLWHKMDKIDIVNKIKRLKIEHGLA